jgi:N-acetylglucosaminyl-diphospho-decaprenol L-rhamnosyltransferase
MDAPEMPPIPLTVVIVNWNGAELLPGCLAPLDGGGIEVIVVDNGSTDASLELLATSFPAVRVVANLDNRGFAAASNQGLRLATSPYVLFLNNDTVPDPKALEELTAFLARNPDTGVVGPALVFPGGQRQPSCGPGPNLWTEILAKTLLHRALPGLREKAPGRTRRVDWVTGAALCIRRDQALELGGLDEAMFMFYEDLDLCARVREAGKQVWFVATPPIVHLGGATRRRVEAQSLIHSYRSADLFFSRHGPRWRRRLLRALTIPEMGLRMGVWGLLSLNPQRRGLARERLAAYRSILSLAAAGRRIR